MNQPELFEYGIQNEASDIRAHVCPVVRRIYIYPTNCGRAALDKGSIKPGFQPGVAGATALGACVPPWEIKKCIALQINDTVWDKLAFDISEDTTTKGNKAVKLVAGMIEAGLFPLPAFTENLITEVSLSLQIKGDDIIVIRGPSRTHIQVKCDFKGGDKELGGTGNLYLQTAERNPLKKI